MDDRQKKLEQTQRPLSRRSTVKDKSRAGSVGGKFVAHGVVPSTFQPIPKPLAKRKLISAEDMERRITSAIIHGSLVHRSRITPEVKARKRDHGLAKLEANNARLAVERPSGRHEEDEAIDRTCGRCGNHFTSKHAFINHAGPCGKLRAGESHPPQKPPSAKKHNSSIRLSILAWYDCEWNGYHPQFTISGGKH